MMKGIIVKFQLLFAVMLLFTGLALAIEPAAKIPDHAIRKPDIKVDAKSTVDATNAKTELKSKIIDINTASEAELKSISGIGSAYASKIIAARPYANKAQLKSRNILPVPVYEQVKELIIARKLKK
jgi:DNA uptake protein ComE-like DNA-binding protein